MSSTDNNMDNNAMKIKQETTEEKENAAIMMKVASVLFILKYLNRLDMETENYLN